MSTRRLYVGLVKGSPGRREVLRTADPTFTRHGDRYGALIGPFRTVAAARLVAGPHGPQIQTVADAERAVRRARSGT